MSKVIQGYVDSIICLNEFSGYDSKVFEYAGLSKVSIHAHEKDVTVDINDVHKPFFFHADFDCFDSAYFFIKSLESTKSPKEDDFILKSGEFINDFLLTHCNKLIIKVNNVSYFIDLLKSGPKQIKRLF